MRSVLTDAVTRFDEASVATMKAEKRTGLRTPARPTVPGMRRHSEGGGVRRPFVPVLPEVPDRRQDPPTAGCPGLK